MLQIDISVLNVVAGTVIPLLVALVLHWSAPSWIKATLNFVLSGVAGLVAVLLQHQGLATKELVLSFALTYLVSGSAHAHLWVPTGATHVAQGKGGFFPDKNWSALMEQAKQALATQRMVVIPSAIPPKPPAPVYGEVPYFANKVVPRDVPDVAGRDIATNHALWPEVQRKLREAHYILNPHPND